MILPSYKINSLVQRHGDFEKLSKSLDIEELSKDITGFKVSDFTRIEAIKEYLTYTLSKGDGDFFQSDSLTNGLTMLVSNLIKVAITFGFPGRPVNNKLSSKIDIALAETLIESLEKAKFEVNPCHANSRYTQEYMTQRIFPLLVYWRWSVVTNKPLSKDRILSSPRNYFYTLWLSGWLFDKGIEASTTRWDLLNQMDSDSLVQVIERSGIGFRKGFAQAIAMERKNRRSNTSNSELEDLVRGCMKRAVFTFSTAVMIDETNYYKEICSYLFDWAKKNYLKK